MKQAHRITGGLAALAAAALLSACGGGGGPVEPPPVTASDVPPSATVSATAYSGFVGSLAPDDGAEPLGLDSVVPPVSDTEDPVEVR